MNFDLAHLPAIVALIAGILILLIPRLLNFIVAIYLIVVGLIGLGVALSDIGCVLPRSGQTRRACALPRDG
jgi:hypothetical protein